MSVCGVQHLDKTPNQYIQWRYATGEDREGVDSVFRKATEEEEKKMAEVIKMADGTKKVLHNKPDSLTSPALRYVWFHGAFFYMANVCPAELQGC